MKPRYATSWCKWPHKIFCNHENKVKQMRSWSVKWLTRDRISLMLQPWSHGPDSYLKSSIFHKHIFFWGIDRLLMNAESGQGELGQLKIPWNISLTKGMVFNTSSEYSSLLTMTSVVDKVNGFRSLLTIGLTVLGRDCDGHRWHCLCKTP